MRTIAVVTVARSDFGIYRQVLRRIQQAPELDLQLIAAGMHLSPEFGTTVDEITRAGFAVAERVEMLLSSDTPEGVAKSMGVGMMGFAQVYARARPDLLVVLGDRFEMLAAAAAALPFTIPIAHIHGGEATEGLIDEPIRHAITKMAHLHFVSMERYRRRVIQMGEAPWRVTVSGAPALDNLVDGDLLSGDDLKQAHGINVQTPPLLVTYHPVTLEYEDTGRQVDNLLAALEMVDVPVVFTYPNADTSGRLIIEKTKAYVARHPDAQVAVSLGTKGYFSLMRHAAAMVGNSSSGIIEAASFGLPVVNVGNRQRGRTHGPNVMDVGYDATAIAGAIRRVTKPKFRKSIAGMENPYGDGRAAERIVDVLKSAELGHELLLKHFHEVPETV